MMLRTTKLLLVLAVALFYSFVVINNMRCDNSQLPLRSTHSGATFIFSKSSARAAFSF
jgi:predicted small integral membrane protein